MKKTVPVVLFAALIIVMMILSFMGAVNEEIGMCITIGLIIVFDVWVAIVAKKSEVKVVYWIMMTFALVGVVLLGLNIYSLMGPKTKTFDFQITVKENISDKVKMLDFEGKEYYTYNLESVNVEFKDDKKYSLEEAFNLGKVKLDEILSQAVPNSGTEGYKIYYDEGQEDYINDRYSIVVCDNGDVIFTNYDYKYNSKICQ